MHALDEAIEKALSDTRRVRPQHANRASQAGIECARRLQWNRTRWQDAKLHDVGLERRFALGRALEPEIIRLVEAAGVKVEQSQRDLSWPALQLTGHIDGTIELDGEKVVLEAKTTSRFSFEKIRGAGSAAELLEDRRSYVRGYVVQAAFYALLMGLPGAVLLFLDKDSGRTHAIDVRLSDERVLEAAEAVLKRFERVNAAIAAGVDLPAEPASHCKECPFLGACAPAQDFGAGLAVLDDGETEGLLARRAELQPLVSEFDEVDEALKERFAAAGEALVGGWHVTVKESLTTRYDVPKDVKAQFAKKVPQLRRTYERVLAGARRR